MLGHQRQQLKLFDDDQLEDSWIDLSKALDLPNSLDQQTERGEQFFELILEGGLEGLRLIGVIVLFIHVHARGHQGQEGAGVVHAGQGLSVDRFHTIQQVVQVKVDFSFADCRIGQALQFRPDPEVHVPVSAGLENVLQRLKHLQSAGPAHLRPYLPQQQRQNPLPHLRRALAHVVLIVCNQLPQQPGNRREVGQLPQPLQHLRVRLEILQKGVEFFPDEDHEALGDVIQTIFL